MDGKIARYQVPSHSGYGDYREKGSKFFAFAFPCISEQEFKDQLQLIKSEHPKASHWCFAFAIGPAQEHSRSNDDGEPSGSAGLPILNAIRSSELSDVGIIVVRYYGGTNLGVSGLIHAYHEAARLSLNEIKIKERVIYRTIELTCNLEHSHIPLQILGKYGWKQIEAQYSDENCVILVDVPIDEIQIWKEEFTPHYYISYSLLED